MNRISHFLCIIAALTCVQAIARSDNHDYSGNDIQQLLSQVDEEIGRRNIYIQQRGKRIDMLKRAASGGGNTASLNKLMAVGEAYKAFNNDSAIHYLSMGEAAATSMGHDSLANVFHLKTIALVPLSGYTGPAIKALQEVDTSGFSHEMMTLYHESARQLYSYLAMMHSKSNASNARFAREALSHQDRLLSLLDHDDPDYEINLAESLTAHGETSRARAIIERMLERLKPDSERYARAAYLMSEIADARGDRDLQAAYLAKSAMADIKSATLEVSSLQALGQRMFADGEIDRAYNYLTSALKSAVESGSEMRVIQSGGALAIMEASHEAQMSSSTRRVNVIMSIMGFLLLVLMVTLIILRNEMTRMGILRDNLEKANRSKEDYISQFLQLCSIYMEKLNQFCTLANRKISAGKVDDLYKMTKSGRFIEEQSQEFYEIFDNAFLHLYPSFVASVNRLLREDGRIILNPDEKLNTDLRILALMRLGIHDNRKIAELLNYSVNTIYSYRNKLRNRAIDHDSFESEVSKIDAPI